MQDIAIIIGADTLIGLRSKIISLFERINKDIHQWVYHKGSQKQDGRQQIQPGLFIVLIHISYLPSAPRHTPVSLAKIRVFLGFNEKATSFPVSSGS